MKTPRHFHLHKALEHICEEATKPVGVVDETITTCKDPVSKAVHQGDMMFPKLFTLTQNSRLIWEKNKNRLFVDDVVYISENWENFEELKKSHQQLV